MSVRRFRDRAEAGRLLAERLEDRVAAEPAVVGLARGGVPVAFEVARSLDGDLDVLQARKVGAPGQPELALGALAPGGAHYNEDLVEIMGLSDDELERLADRERQELEDRVDALRDECPELDLAGRDVIVVDDGVATGATMFAAVEAVRGREPARVIVAVPVGAPDTVAALREPADDVVCLREPADFTAVGAWYEDFSQTTDAEVLALLEEARERRERAAAAASGQA